MFGDSRDGVLSRSLYVTSVRYVRTRDAARAVSGADFRCTARSHPASLFPCVSGRQWTCEREREASVAADSMSALAEHPYILIGDKNFARDRAALRHQRVLYVINVTPPLTSGGVANFFEKEGSIEYLRLPLRDVAADSILPHVAPAVEFLQRARVRADGCVLVHCNEGKSRSAGIVVAFLMRAYNRSFDDALAAVQAVRPQAEPRETFARQLRSLASATLPCEVDGWRPPPCSSSGTIGPAAPPKPPPCSSSGAIGPAAPPKPPPCSSSGTIGPAAPPKRAAPVGPTAPPPPPKRPAIGPAAPPPSLAPQCGVSVLPALAPAPAPLPVPSIGPAAIRPTRSATRPAVVLVRSHNPTAAMLGRLCEWKASLAAAGISLHVSVDVSHGRTAADELHAALGAHWLEDVSHDGGSACQGAASDASATASASALPPTASATAAATSALTGTAEALVHVYDEAAMLSAYPHLAALRLRMVGEAEWAGLGCTAPGQDAAAVARAAKGAWRRWAGGPRSSIAWGFHAEAIALWWRDAKPLLLRSAQDSALDVWVLEDDVGFTAPLSELVLAYAESTADLITYPPKRCEPVHDVHCKAAAEGSGEGASLGWDGWCCTLSASHTKLRNSPLAASSPLLAASSPPSPLPPNDPQIDPGLESRLSRARHVHRAVCRARALVAAAREQRARAALLGAAAGAARGQAAGGVLRLVGTACTVALRGARPL